MDGLKIGMAWSATRPFAWCELTVMSSLKRLLLLPETWHRTLTAFQSHACDDEELHLRCTPSTVISVHYVFYGRQAGSGHLCPDRSTAFISTACESTKALQIVHDRCHKHRSCRLYISKDTFRDDPCPDVRKFIEVMYKCRPDGFLNKIVCEGGQLDLLCPEGQGLTIFSASYGTTKEGVVECRQSEGFELKDCVVGRSDETLRSLCSGKQNCSLRADDRTFGSPGCRGTKHLKVAYNCVERVLLRPAGRHPAEEAIQTTSFPAWVRGVDHSAHSNLWPGNQSFDQYLSVHNDAFSNPPTSRRLEEAVVGDWLMMIKFKAS
ncbi:Protein eva-1 C [Araneus ventricosus]|uniref:Protein eva-1 C n=1 Tax=Araneus ventricosus TaxID=182803 RepID=A0A4Y2MTG9_ARAVE|nr:Protein eva-1 C [Araneus ventricosus]